MPNKTPQQIAGIKLRQLIERDYDSQEAFAYNYGIEIRTLSRYLNNGINKIDAVQALANYFNVDFLWFFKIEEAPIDETN